MFEKLSSGRQTWGDDDYKPNGFVCICFDCIKKENLVRKNFMLNEYRMFFAETRKFRASAAKYFDTKFVNEKRMSNT